MGGQPSRNEFVRQANIERRSQRKSVYTVRKKLEKLYIDIKKFNGVEEDEEFHRIMSIIYRMRKDLQKQQALQPQVINIYEKTLNALDDAEESLEDQLQDNQEYFKERHEELKERKAQLEATRNETDKSKNKKDKQLVKSARTNGITRRQERQLVMSDDDYYAELEEKPRRTRKKVSEANKPIERRFSFPNRKVTREEEADEDDDEYEEYADLKSKQVSRTRSTKSLDDILDVNPNNGQSTSNGFMTTPKKGKTVEISLVKVIPEGKTEVEVHEQKEETKSPSEKRKSILKMGIPVMSNAMKNLISKKSKKISVQYSDDVKEYSSDEILKIVNNTIEELKNIEDQIANFVGRKYGEQYNNIRDKLNHFLVELSQYNVNEDYVIEQIKLCKSFVSSCLNFLDERAVDKSLYDSRDDVFLPEPSTSRPMSPAVTQQQIQPFSKSTAV